MKKILAPFQMQFLLIVGLMLISFGSFASSAIDIDNDSRSLVAPEGSQYQWYINGDVYMGGIDQTLKIKESGAYSVEFVNEEGEKETTEITVAVTPQAIRKIFVISDSIAANYGTRYYPQVGWGQVLQLFFDDTKVQVNNRARGGRSSRSYYQEGLWSASSGVAAPSGWTYVSEEVSTGDFVFIQFGANDRSTKPERQTSPEEMKTYLRTYINETRAKGGIPVLVTPLMLSGTRNVYTESGSDYRGSMEAVSKELDVLFIDVNMKSFAFNKEMGSDYTGKFIYLGLEAGEYPNSEYSGGVNDGTHIQEMGAYKVCDMIIEGLKELTDNADAAALVAALKPTYDVTVNRGTEKSGLLTQSGKFPVGTRITLKQTTNTGFTFKRWEDENNNSLGTENRIEFDMTAKNYTFTCVYEDCLGNENGTGYYDNCATCIDGIVNKTACTNAIESEKACSTSGTYATKTENNEEVNYLVLATGGPDTVHYVVRTGADGNYTLAMKYNGAGSGQTFDIYVNNKKQQSDVTLNEADDTVWKLQEFTVDMLERDNIVTLVFPEVKQNINIDLLATYESTVRLGLSRACENIGELQDIPLATEAKGEINVFPNPFAGTATLKVNKPTTYKLISLSGITMEEGFCQDELQIGERLDAGIYIIQLGADSQPSKYLIIKE